MDDIIFALRVITSIAWLAVIVLTVRSGWQAIKRHGGHNEAILTAFAFFGLLIIGFNLRWLLSIDNNLVWLGLYALSGLLAIYVMRLTWAVR